MSEQATYSNDPDDMDGQEGVLDRVGEPSDVDIDATDEPDIDIDDESYDDTPDDLGGTGGPDAGGAG